MSESELRKAALAVLTKRLPGWDDPAKFCIRCKCVLPMVGKYDNGTKIGHDKGCPVPALETLLADPPKGEGEHG